MDTPTTPTRSRMVRADVVTIDTRRGKITFPSVRKAAFALKVHRAKLTRMLRRKHPRNAYYAGLTPPARLDDDEWEEMTDEERALWDVERLTTARTDRPMVADDRSVIREIEERLRLGRDRYGHGVLVPANADKNWKRELLEELFDAVVYAAADVLTERGVADDEANDALTALVRERVDADHQRPVDIDTLDTLDACIFVAKLISLRSNP